MTNNCLQKMEDIKVLNKCKKLSIVDLAMNKLDDEGIIEVSI